jgi:hypothetical protein
LPINAFLRKSAGNNLCLTASVTVSQHCRNQMLNKTRAGLTMPLFRRLLFESLDPGTSQKTASKPVRKQPECSGVNVGFGDLRTSGGDQLRDPRLRRVSGTKFFILMFTSGHDNPTLRAEKRWQRN